MRGNAEVIAQLNEALREELTAINQYFLHAEMCHNWGYHALGKYIKKQSIDEMRHAEKIIERLLFLCAAVSVVTESRPASRFWRNQRPIMKTAGTGIGMKMRMKNGMMTFTVAFG